MQDYFVYILECNDGSYYTGITTDTERRLRQHNGELVGGAKYTSARRPVQLLAISTRLSSRSEASKLEYKVKKQKKGAKVAFLEAYESIER
ncbi:MAG: GIY-YIG nuclease family protein [Lentisphaeraceae bacterium]|nr:GIY-YIG nuclease family protein [Lentisphaeraceae bacterium]